jgi:hypothetical protein
MTNIVTNADGSITITFPPKITEWGIYIVHPFALAIVVVAIVVLSVWIIAGKKRKSSN